MIKLKPRTTNIQAAISVQTSEAHQASILGMVNDELSQYGFNIDEEVGLVINPSEDGLSVMLCTTFADLDKTNYNSLLACKHSYIGNTKEVNSYWSKTMHHYPQDVETRVTFMLSAPLDQDDLMTLRKLGKVQSRIKEATIEESVSCVI